MNPHHLRGVHCDPLLVPCDGVPFHNDIRGPVHIDAPVVSGYVIPRHKDALTPLYRQGDVRAFRKVVCDHLAVRAPL